MGNFAMTIWNSTCTPCFSTFDQFFFVFHGLKTGFFCYSLKLSFICYSNRFITYDYSLWDGGRHTFLRAKTNFNFDIKFVCLFILSSHFRLKDRPGRLSFSYADLLAFLFSVDKSIGSGHFFPDLDPSVNLTGHNGNDQITIYNDYR